MSEKFAKNAPPKEIPEVVIDPITQKRYHRGKFLGKGGFARCYELLDVQDDIIYAGKAVPKSLLVKKHQKDKMVQEIQIHRSLNHKHVVGFHCYFEDNDFVYVLLELCRKRSLMELHKRRRAVTEVEARYFTYQLIDACVYLHDTRVIHRDLKLGNLFLNDDMEVKVGDFGLATKLDFDGERKKTLCGTPNYIAPEMLRKAGHSYEVDVWAIGCVLFTLLVGKPPFETESLKETYIRIKRNEYHIPSKISPVARQIIERMLHPEPSHRPSVRQLLTFDFFTQGYLPHRLPASCLTTAPKSLNHVSNTSLRKPLGETTNMNEGAGDAMDTKPPPGMYSQQPRGMAYLKSVPEDQVMMASNGDGDKADKDDELPKVPADWYLKDLLDQLTALQQKHPASLPNRHFDEAEDPKFTPVFWISKWVDYSDKYGLGYQLSDNSVGVLFNDSTKLVLNRDGQQVQYIEKDAQEAYFNLNYFPPELSKKITLLKYFRSYMNEHLLKAGAEVAQPDVDELARLPYLRTWFRTRSAIVLHLTNGLLQLNFFQDHTKLMLCPLMKAVTYINENKEFRTYPFSAIEELGCSKDLERRLNYAKMMVERLLTFRSSTTTANIRSIASGAVPIPPASSHAT